MKVISKLKRLSTPAVEHEFVWKALTEQGIQQKYVRLLAKLYNNSQAKIRTERDGEYFSLERGVKQGDPLSPKLSRNS